MTTHRWRLDGQTALITGASAGIGLAIARELLGFGADLLMVARDADALAQARDELADESFPSANCTGWPPMSPTMKSAAPSWIGWKIMLMACIC